VAQSNWHEMLFLISFIATAFCSPQAVAKYTARRCKKTWGSSTGVFSYSFVAFVFTLSIFTTIPEKMRAKANKSLWDEHPSKHVET